MCLNIDTKLHKSLKGNGKTRKPFVADRPILVWKRLTSYDMSGRPDVARGYLGESPYYDTTYYNGHLMTADKFTYGNSYYSDRYAVVEAGLHSHRIKPKISPFSAQKAFPAIIPAGAEFYISNDGEIASKQLIVYKNMAELSKVHGTPGPGVKVKKAVGKFVTTAEE